MTDLMSAVLPRWAQRVFGVLFVDDLWARWSCDQCQAMGVHRRVALIFGRHWKHELTHTDEEWAAAGYDKQGTLDFYKYGPDGKPGTADTQSGRSE